MTDKRFAELLAAYIESDASEEDIAELHQAIGSSPQLRERFQEEFRLHVLIREAMVEDVEMQAFYDALPAPAAGVSRRRMLIGAMAAAIAVAAIMTGIWLGSDSTPSGPAAGVCLDISGNGQVLIERNSQRLQARAESTLHADDRIVCDEQAGAMLRLTDGSIVSMEPGAKLALLSGGPFVKLEKGEVLFEIAAREPGMPAFEVRSAQSTVAVRGTVFTLAAGDQTELKVYEGLVNFTRHSDSASVEVGSQQMTSTSVDDLTVRDLSAQTSQRAISVTSLLPTDDITLDLGQRAPGPHLKVEGNRRTAYLRYVVPSVGKILSAKLRLTQAVDTGKGALSFFIGDSSKWNEANLTEAAAPAPGPEVARRTGVVRRRQVIEVDLSDAVKSPGAITIIIKLDKTKEHDIWFGSKESDTPPQLILSHH